MKTSIKLVLIYFLMQLLGSLTALPLAMLYCYLTTGEIGGDQATLLSLAPSLILGAVYMYVFLLKGGYLKNDGYLYSTLSPAYIGWSLAAGVSMIVLVDAVMTQLSFLPDWMRASFDVMQSGWAGIAGICLIGPILEELLFRGAVTKTLLRQYSPTTAILLSALIFGLFHINPVQVVGAFLSGVLFAWLYYKSRSLLPCILIHVLNNSLSTFFSIRFPEVEYMYQFMEPSAYYALVGGAVMLMCLSLYMINRSRLNVRPQTAQPFASNENPS